MRKSLHFWALAVAMFLPMFATAQTHSLTVADGTDVNSRIPVYGNYAEQAQQCQIVYSAAMIEAAAMAARRSTTGKRRRFSFWEIACQSAAMSASVGASFSIS